VICLWRPQFYNINTIAWIFLNIPTFSDILVNWLWLRRHSDFLYTSRSTYCIIPVLQRQKRVSSFERRQAGENEEKMSHISHKSETKQNVFSAKYQISRNIWLPIWFARNSSQFSNVSRKTTLKLDFIDWIVVARCKGHDYLHSWVHAVLYTGRQILCGRPNFNYVQL